VLYRLGRPPQAILKLTPTRKCRLTNSNFPLRLIQFLKNLQKKYIYLKNAKMLSDTKKTIEFGEIEFKMRRYNSNILYNV